MLIEIRPLELEKWHNKKGKESFSRPKTIRALIDTNTLEYQTGLDNVHKSFDHPEGGSEKLTELAYYSLKLNKDLTPLSNETPHEFWDSQTATVKLENRTMFLNTLLPLDYIKWKICKASKFVANSMKEYEDGFFPEATHVIFDEREEVEVKATKVALRHQAVLKSAKLSLSKKVQLVQILGDRNLKHQSSDFVEVELDKLIQEKPKELIYHIERDSKELALHAIVVEALQKSILRRVGHKYLYFDSVLGSEVSEVIAYLNKNENQDLKIRIMEQINQ